MKIGIDARLWSQSGVGRYTRNLVSELQKIDKVNQYVLFMGSEDVGKFKVQSSKFKVVETDINWHSVKEQTQFPKILEKEKLDLVHFPYFSVPIFYNKPFVVTIHDLIINHFPTGKASTRNIIFYNFKRLGYKIALWQSIRKAKKIITVSNATKEEIKDHFKVNQDKIEVTYEGTDEINGQLTIDNGQWTKIEGGYFLYVGNAYPHKNLEGLIKAFSSLKKDSVKLVLVGRKDFFYKRLINNCKNKNIIFAGEVSDAELSSLYKNALALVSASLMEGFGLPVVEAMINKCLVVCSDIPSFREITNGHAIFFNPNNPDDIYEKLSYVKKNYSKLGEVRTVAYNESKKYSWEKMAKETLKIYLSANSR